MLLKTKVSKNSNRYISDHIQIERDSYCLTISDVTVVLSIAMLVIILNNSSIPMLLVEP